MVDRVDGMKTVSFDPGSVFVFFFFAKTLFGFTGQRIGRTEDVWQRRAFQLHAVPQELDWPTLHGLVAGLVYGPWSIWRKSSHRPPLSVCFTSVFLRLCVFFSSQKSGAIVLTNGYVHDYEPWGKWLRLECSVFNHVWSVHIGKKKANTFSSLPCTRASIYFLFPFEWLDGRGGSENYGAGGGGGSGAQTHSLSTTTTVRVKKLERFTHRGYDNNDGRRYEKMETIIM